MTTQKAPPKVSTSDLATILGLSSRRVRQFVAEGIIPPPAKTGHDLAIAVQSVIANARQTKDTAPLAAARARAADARARKIELESAALDGSLIALESAREAMKEMAGMFVSALESLPARIGQSDLSARRLVRDEVDALRAEIHATIVQKCQKLEQKS